MKPNYQSVRKKMAEKQIARAQLIKSASHAKKRFKPGNLIQEGKSNAEDFAYKIIDESIGVIIQHKWPLAGVAVAAGAFFARKPLYNWARKLRTTGKYQNGE